MKRNFTISVLIIIFLILIDQFIKYIIRIKGGFYICNKGIAFGIGFDYFYLLVFSILLFYIFIKIFNLQFSIFKQSTVYNLQFTKLISLILIISGGISNIIDRIIYGCVIDYIDLKFWPIFNLADIYITIGGMALAYKLLINRTK